MLRFITQENTVNIGVHRAEKKPLELNCRFYHDDRHPPLLTLLHSLIKLIK